MKTRIQKIIIMAVALLFLVAGVSFADALNDSWHKPLGHAYGDYKKGYNYHPVYTAVRYTTVCGIGSSLIELHNNAES